MNKEVENLISGVLGEYSAGFDPNIDSDVIPYRGISEEVVRYISNKNAEPDWLLSFRLDAFSKWKGMVEPHFAAFDYPNIDYNDMYYFSEPVKNDKLVDEKILKTYDRLGVPLAEQKILRGMAVDAVVDSRSVKTTLKKQLLDKGIIFCPISEAVHDYPEMVRKYLASVVGVEDNFFACLNSAVFGDGTFVYIPKGVKSPVELSSYFRLQTEKLGQFERTLIIADEGSELSYLEGCSAPIRSEFQLHSGVVELVALDNAFIKYSTVQNWYGGDKDGLGGIYNFVTKRANVFNNATVSWTQLEVGSIKTWKYPSCILYGDNSRGEFYSVAITNNYQAADTGTKMIHLGKNSSSVIHTKGVALGHSQNTYRGIVDVGSSASGVKNWTKCDNLIIGTEATSNAIPLIKNKNSQSLVEHEASFLSISDDQMFFLQSRGMDENMARGLIVNGFCVDIVSRLPAEFKLEAKELINISIEG